MRIIEFKPEATANGLAEAVYRFEHQFSFPLSEGRSFRKLHDRDYSRFFRAIGPAACFVALDDSDAVLGTIGLATTTLRLPGGKTRTAAYIADFKVAPEARYGPVIHRLGFSAFKWAVLRCSLVFSVVIDGAPQPASYTGRLGIPAFSPLAPLALVDMPTSPFASHAPDDTLLADEHTVRDTFQRLTGPRIASLGGNPALRAHWRPVWLTTPEGDACACIEDNRLAKRLLNDEGRELLSRHLTFFAAENPDAAHRILRDALARTARDDVPSLYAVLPPDDARHLNETVFGGAARITPATIYGYTPLRLPDAPWSLHAAEI